MFFATFLINGSADIDYCVLSQSQGGYVGFTKAQEGLRGGYIIRFESIQHFPLLL
jgi:hypothetical protein